MSGRGKSKSGRGKDKLGLGHRVINDVGRGRVSVIVVTGIEGTRKKLI